MVYLQLVAGPVWPGGGGVIVCVCVCAYRREYVCVCVLCTRHVLNAYWKRLGENRSQGSRSHAGSHAALGRLIGVVGAALGVFHPSIPSGAVWNINSETLKQQLVYRPKFSSGRTYQRRFKMLKNPPACWDYNSLKLCGQRVCLLYMHMYGKALISDACFLILNKPLIVSIQLKSIMHPCSVFCHRHEWYLKWCALIGKLCFMWFYYCCRCSCMQMVPVPNMTQWRWMLGVPLTLTCCWTPPNRTSMY